MLKKSIYLSALVIVLFGCAAKKTSVSKSQGFPQTISYSTGFDIFIKNLNIESQGLVSLDDYVPSNTMQKNFNFVTMPDDSPGIEGFIQVIPELFDALAFEEMGGYLIYFAQGIYQYKMPVKSLRNMLDIRGLVMVDIPRKKKSN
ncbi:MAG: hypothetical protein LBT04_09430 [Prevotellaceae bacterium]|jgi:hypothetical protein|nr:hypothetical protein [Prevotellaceae bacterium]